MSFKKRTYGHPSKIVPIHVSVNCNSHSILRALGLLLNKVAAILLLDHVYCSNLLKCFKLNKFVSEYVK